MADTSDTTPATASRRGILGAFAALGAAGASALDTARAAGPSPDADLIRLCGKYMDAVAAYNADGGNLECSVDPLWHAIDAVEEQMEGLSAQTIDGLVAKARVAQSQAQLPDGHENYCTSQTGDWPEQVVRDLLRLYGGAA